MRCAVFAEKNSKKMRRFREQKWTIPRWKDAPFSLTENGACQMRLIRTAKTAHLFSRKRRIFFWKIARKRRIFFSEKGASFFTENGASFCRRENGACHMRQISPPKTAHLFSLPKTAHLFFWSLRKTLHVLRPSRWTQKRCIKFQKKSKDAPFSRVPNSAHLFDVFQTKICPNFWVFDIETMNSLHFQVL